MVNVVFGHSDYAEDELLVRDDPEKTAQVIGLMPLGRSQAKGGFHRINLVGTK